MKIILISPPLDITKTLGDGGVYSPPFDPMGIMYIASYLRTYNPEITVEIIDAFLERYTIDQLLSILAQKNPDIVGITTVTANGHEVFELGRQIKRKLPGIFVVLGNLHASIFKDVYLKHSACDVVVHGEGEATMLELSNALLSGQRDLSGIQGISFRDGDTLIDTSARGFLDLADIPFPARDLIDYFEYGHKPRNYSYVLASRGCVFRCHFCVVHQSKYRFRPVQDIISEVKTLWDRYRIPFFTFGDPLFLGNRKFVTELCEAIIHEGLHKYISWWCEAHVNTVNEDLLRLMKAAGCQDLSFGIESGNDEILKRCNKKSNTEKIAWAVELTHRLGFNTRGCFILGLPGDTEETVEQTIRFANKLPLDTAQFSTFTPYPGSYFYYQLMEQDYFKVNFENVEEVLSFWDRFSAYTAFTDHLIPIYAPEGISPERLKQLQKQANIRFYLKPKHFWAQMKTIRASNALGVAKAALRLFRK